MHFTYAFVIDWLINWLIDGLFLRFGGFVLTETYSCATIGVYSFRLIPALSVSKKGVNCHAIPY